MPLLSRIAILAAFLVAASPPLRASDELQQLQRRLAAAEARLAELEASQSPTEDPLSVSASPAETAVLTSPVAWSTSDSDDTSPFESRIEELEARWEKKWNEQTATNTTLEKAIGKRVKPGTSWTDSMKLSGRIHLDYWGIPGSSSGINLIETGDPASTPQDRAGFRRMRFGVGGDVTPGMAYRIELELAAGNRSEFRDAWIRAKTDSWLHDITVGNHKRPYGLDHLNSSRYNVFVERPFVIEAFNQDARRLGISSQGYSDDKEWNWRFGVWNQRLIQDEGLFISDHLQAEIAGRLARTWWYEDDGRRYGHWAVAASLAHPDGSSGSGPLNPGVSEAQNEARFRHRPEARTANRWLGTGRIEGADWYELIGLEQVLNFGPLQLVNEYQSIFLQRDDGFRDVHLHGAYFYASYFLTGEHMPWNRRTGTLGRPEPHRNFFLVDKDSNGWGAWQVAVRYSYADFNDFDSVPGITVQDVAGGLGESLTVGLNWLWNPNTRVQVNYINGTITNRDVAGSLTSGRYDIVGARFLIDF